MWALITGPTPQALEFVLIQNAAVCSTAYQWRDVNWGRYSVRFQKFETERAALPNLT
jgi:hypothetical protein